MEKYKAPAHQQEDWRDGLIASAFEKLGTAVIIAVFLIFNTVTPFIFWVFGGKMWGLGVLCIMLAVELMGGIIHMWDRGQERHANHNLEITDRILRITQEYRLAEQESQMGQMAPMLMAQLAGLFGETGKSNIRLATNEGVQGRRVAAQKELEDFRRSLKDSESEYDFGDDIDIEEIR